MRKYITRGLIIFVSIFLILFVINQTIKIDAKNNSYYAKDFSAFQEGLMHQQTAIEVGDIDFSGNIISLNYSLKIYSSKKVTLKNVYFVLSGPNITGEEINIEFENIVFDGGFSIDEDLLKQELAFEDIFGSDRESNRCINISSGYANLSVSNCEFKNYASEIGSVIFLENVYRDAKRVVTIKNSKVYNNYSYYDTIHLSNDLMDVNISDSEFYNNYGYKGQALSVANGSCNIINCNIHDNKYVGYDINKDNVQLCGGGLYFGGTKGKVENTIITNNESYYGGGIGISSQKFGENQMVIIDTVIKNNKAVYGGGIAAMSLLGQPITFINCDISYNEATYASAIYSTVYGYFNKNNNGGLVEFIFSSFINNKATDLDTLSFYKEDETKGLLGSISLKGCIFIGDDTFTQNNDYNYACNLSSAIEKGIITEKVVNAKESKVILSKDSDAYIKVKQSEYQTWSTYLSSYKGNRVIGFNGESRSFNFVIPIAVIVVLVFLIVITILIIKHFRKQPLSDNEPDTLTDKINEIEELKQLSNREKDVFRLTIEGKKRKEIATLLFYSENTVKKDLSSIYKKLEVNDKSELMIKYKHLL